MTDDGEQADAKELREAILDEVIKLYWEACAVSGETELPPHIQKIPDRIFYLVEACGIKE